MSKVPDVNYLAILPKDMKYEIFDRLSTQDIENIWESVDNQRYPQVMEHIMEYYNDERRWFNKLKARKPEMVQYWNSFLRFQTADGKTGETVYPIDKYFILSSPILLNFSSVVSNNYYTFVIPIFLTDLSIRSSNRYIYADPNVDFRIPDYRYIPNIFGGHVVYPTQKSFGPYGQDPGEYEDRYSEAMSDNLSISEDIVQILISPSFSRLYQSIITGFNLYKPNIDNPEDKIRRSLCLQFNTLISMYIYGLRESKVSFTIIKNTRKILNHALADFFTDDTSIPHRYEDYVNIHRYIQNVKYFQRNPKNTTIMNNSGLTMLQNLDPELVDYVNNLFE